jgi:beta-lactamase class D
VNVFLDLPRAVAENGEVRLPRRFLVRVAILLAVLMGMALPQPAAALRKKAVKAQPKKKALARIPQARSLRAAAPTKKTSLKQAAKKKRRFRRAINPWRVPTFADPTAGDEILGEDPDVREAAVEALGRWNGTVIVAEAETGRVLTIVNQKLALRPGYQPCSTVKIPVALAALRELLIERDDEVRVGRRVTMDMTKALAVSNNQYFAKLGGELGFDRVQSWAREFGLGEKAGLDIEGESAGLVPAGTPKAGVGRMTSFGDGIRLTPLGLTAMMGALANGGTLYYLQYPKGGNTFVPEVKRELDIAEVIPEIMPGMQGAVEYGTARRAAWHTKDPEPIFGKTGTCTDQRTPTHLGWFGSFGDVDGEKLVVTVLLTGGRGVSGPAASGIAGEVYRRLRSGS